MKTFFTLAMICTLTWTSFTAFAAQDRTPKENSVQKMNFEDVVVQSLSRAPGSMDTVGVVKRKRKDHSLYRKRTDFTDSIPRNVIELGDSL